MREIMDDKVWEIGEWSDEELYEYCACDDPLTTLLEWRRLAFAEHERGVRARRRVKEMKTTIRLQVEANLGLQMDLKEAQDITSLIIDGYDTTADALLTTADTLRVTADKLRGILHD